MSRITALAIAAFALSACVPTSPSSGVAEEDEPIIGGMNSDATQNSVIRISVRSDGGVYECSGTLLAPNLVLTARHCVSATADESVGCTSKGVGDAGGMVFGDFDPTTMTVGYGNTRGRADGGMGGMRPTMMGDAGVRPHGMKIYHDDSTNLCNHDLALILLDTKIAGALISPIRLDDPPAVGETFTAIGWGVTSTTPNPTTRQERADVAITAVGPSNDFGGVAPNEFLIGEAICSGDSGGPALDSDSNAILGVVSRGGNGVNDPNNPSAGCIGARNIYTQVMPFSDLIMQAYTEAGATPWLEGTPNPNLGATGDACATGAACQSGMCLGGGDAGGGICTQECTVYVCPAGLECQNGLGTRVCGPPGHTSKGGCSTQPTLSSGEAPSALWLVLPLVGGSALLRRRRRA
jgi:MYXO-CTERM domain-containing protein